MSERSVKCPDCTFSFASLVDAGDYHAYLCGVCGWTRPTDDRRPGNRPADVCALCDGPIDMTTMNPDLHLYFGSGWVHGGGRENIPIHTSCANAIRDYERTGTLWTDGCSCPPLWRRGDPDRHLVWCQQYRSAA